MPLWNVTKTFAPADGTPEVTRTELVLAVTPEKASQVFDSAVLAVLPPSQQPADVRSLDVVVSKQRALHFLNVPPGFEVL